MYFEDFIRKKDDGRVKNAILELLSEKLEKEDIIEILTNEILMKIINYLYDDGSNIIREVKSDIREVLEEYLLKNTKEYNNE